MTSSTHTRHGLYLPLDLLDRIRLLAARENKSINKQIEDILQEWFALKRKKRAMSRKELLSLPIERRHQILREQAEKMKDIYEEQEDPIGGQTDLFEYD